MTERRQWPHWLRSLRHALSCDYCGRGLARLRTLARWWPAVGPAAAAISAWGVTSLLMLRIAVSAWAIGYGILFFAWRSADDRARRLAARGDRSLPCATCAHYACDGQECVTCDGACTAAAVMSLPRPSVPRPRADWLN